MDERKVARDATECVGASDLSASWRASRRERKMGFKATAGYIALAAFAILIAAGYGFAQEHPGHSAEHPSSRPSKTESSYLTKEELAEAIEAYVAEDAALHGGFFLVYDDVDEMPLVLSLKKVHKERLSKIADDEYFACADFTTPEGKVYDLDILMKGKEKKHLDVTEIIVHKEAGEARYTWHEHDGLWMRHSK